MHLPELSRIAIAGAGGLVGQELQSILLERRVQQSALDCSGSASACKLAFLAVPESTASSLADAFVSSGAIVIDLSAASRVRDQVPLVVPSINGHVLERNPAIIASPNCTATILSTALAPLRQFDMASVHVSTYQAVSGAGQEALRELDSGPADSEPVLGEPLCGNVFRHESPVDRCGHTGEERKLIDESRRLLDLPNLQVSATCMRVPTRRSHLESVSVQLGNPPPIEQVAGQLADQEGITLLRSKCPTAVGSEGRDDILVGHLRMTGPDTVSFVVAGDQLRVGAALNAVQIAEQLPD
ncbi:MAG: Asd/ArgC dimerization domain-containing protein [Phycisphaerales bacterium]|jgi:aspartate-semialdehyde dehydrogenase|nr:Asd/ArgC dimerization domain-containing protein [Phycisphaerales bacterium]